MTSRKASLLNLCACLRGEFPAAPSWTSLLEAANQSLTTPALREFAVTFRDRLPDDVATYINQMFEANGRRNRKLVDQTCDAVAALNEVGIQPILLKGAGRLLTAPVHQLGTRITWDIDLMVDPAAANRSLARLQQQGYRVRHQSLDDRSHWFANLERAGEAAYIDLHTRPPGYAYFESSLGSLERYCRPVSVGPISALLPDPTVQALILIVHDQLHDADFMLGKLSMIHLLDLRELSVASPGIDWAELASFFPDAFLRDALYTQLHTLWALLGVDIPIAMRGGPIPRFQHWRRLAQMDRPQIKDSLLGLSLLLELPAFLAHRSRTKEAYLTRQEGGIAHIAPGWSRFQFLRGLAAQQKLGKLQ